VERIVGVRLGNCWPGHVGDVMATPVSDGEIVGVAFGHGQIAAYEVATGKRLWAFRDPTLNANSVSHAPSPLLWKDLLIVTVGGGKGLTPTLLALDKRTGAVRWESPGGQGGCPIGTSHGDHMSHYLARLGGRAYIVTNKGAVLDAETGSELVAKLPSPAGKNQGLWGSGFIAGSGDLVFKTWGGDCSAPPCESWQLKPVGTDTLEAVERPPIPFSNSHGPFALSDKALAMGSVLLDPRTGARLTGKTDRKSPDVPNGTTTIAGNYLIQTTDLTGSWHRSRPDALALALFTIVDISDLAKPKVVSSNNLLGSDAMPPDIVDTYFPEVGKNPAWKGHLLGCYKGLPWWFGVRMSGVSAHGARLYILSSSHLYCIGEK
jgi:outer membrane protein assembly factor BamB